MGKIKNLFLNIKENKKLQVIFIFLVGIILVVCYFSISFDKKPADTNIQSSTEKFTSANEYVDYLENKLCSVLSKISGVGEVNAVITLESGFTYEYATDSETKSTTSNSTTTTIDSKNIIVVNNKPVVIREIYPIVKGVVIVAEGSENFNIKMSILDAVQTILEIESESIIILH